MLNKKKESVAYPELFCFIVVIFSALLLFISRIGFDYNSLKIVNCVFISFFSIFFPFYINKYFSRINISNFFCSKSFLIIIVFFILLIFGILNEIFYFNISFILSIIGIFFAINFLLRINIHEVKILFILLAIIFSFWATAAHYIYQYMHPLMNEKIIVGAWAHRDAVWHSAIAGMLKTYNKSSIGLDGLETLYYHSFSNFLYGKFSSLTLSNTLNFYSGFVTILISPIFFLSAITCIDELSIFFAKKLQIKKYSHDKILYWLVLFVLFSIPLPMEWLFETYHFFHSQSYTIALIFTFCLIGVLINALNNSYYLKHNNVIFKIFFLIFFLTIFISISLSKLSFLYFICASFGFFYLRLSLIRLPFINVLLSLLLLAVLLIYILVIFEYQKESSQFGFEVSIFFMLKENFQFYWTYIYVSLIYIITKLYLLKIYNFKKLKQLIFSNNIIEIEYLLFLSIALPIFPYQYSNGIQIYVAYLLIMSNLNLFIPNIYFNKLSYTSND